MDSNIDTVREGGLYARQNYLLELNFGVLMHEEGIIAGFYGIRGSWGMLPQENF